MRAREPGAPRVCDVCMVVSECACRVCMYVFVCVSRVSCEGETGGGEPSRAGFIARMISGLCVCVCVR